MASVTLESVSCEYASGARAVDELTLRVEDQEFLVLVGPSGCGKSTTLRMIAGLETPSAGEIRIGERVVNETPPSERDIAMVFQNYALYPHLTVYQNLAFGLELRYGGDWWSLVWMYVTRPSEVARLSALREGIPERVRETARTLGIEHLLERLPGQLSGGERQRVALGRAIVRQPAAFLFDEPLSNLDAQLRVEMRREIKQLHRRLATTMVYVTHDQVEALTLGDRIAVMDRGVLQQVGTPEEVYDRPRNRFVAGFLGSPPMNFVAGRLDAEGGQTYFVGAGLKLALPRKEDSAPRDVELGVRPEDVLVGRRGGTNLRGGAAANGRVSLVESLGDSALVHVELNSTEKANQPKTLVAKTEARPGLAAGDEVELGLRVERCHLFDMETGESLGQ